MKNINLRISFTILMCMYQNVESTKTFVVELGPQLTVNYRSDKLPWSSHLIKRFDAELTGMGYLDFNLVCDLMVASRYNG